ncbi:hypothetical protein EW146_g2941 [Bondarzewia mesenterica]|uniref:Uncharacterized protein n=1 Tax=Bondarzewia mesenterica TaxID=1095465 RepID=A0A4S4LZI6_9AGAM|nr:hypothetical protein EW146_g2941 [Bondarzewia mesenterica]
MSTVVDVSSKLGEYMLKGWVLTDKSCPTPGCRVPLMRSPNGQTPVIWFCANCEGNSASHHPTGSAASADSVRNTSPSLGSSTHYSRPSTPPTEVSSTLSSPTFALPAETAETVRRRQQSDFASAEIGKRMLKGWAMLADECPNSTCYGVPLVRPPRAGGEKDPRKECVVCGNAYVDERDSNGFERLRTIELGVRQQPLRPPVPLTAALGSSSQDKGKAVARDETPMAASSSLPPLSSTSLSKLHKAPQPLNLSQLNAVPKAPLITTVPHQSPITQASLDASVHALESTLLSLSQRLLLHSGQTIVDPSSIGQTADAMSKVAQALLLLKQLQ